MKLGLCNGLSSVFKSSSVLLVLASLAHAINRGRGRVQGEWLLQKRPANEGRYL